MKLLAQDRDDISHHLRIESVDENDQSAQTRNQELITAERLLIDKLTDVEYGVLFQSGVNIARDLSGNQDHFTGCPPAGKLFVRLPSIGKREHVIDFELQFAAFKPPEQIGSSRLNLIAAHRVVGQ